MRPRRCEAGTLELGAGLEVLVSASLATLDDGDLLDVFVDSRSSSLELPAWARRAGHEIVDERRDGDAYVVTLRASLARPPVEGPTLHATTFPTAELRRLAGPEPPEAPRDAGLFPLGTLPEQVVRHHDWGLSSRDRLWGSKLASLTDRAARSQWDATRDIPWQAVVGLNAAWLTFAIIAENFTSAIGTVIFVAYLSALCRNPLHTATQYALLTALAAFGRTYLSAGAGYIAAATGWVWFFAICALAGLPALVLLAWLYRRGHFEGLMPARTPAPEEAPAPAGDSAVVS